MINYENGNTKLAVEEKRTPAKTTQKTLQLNQVSKRRQQIQKLVRLHIPYLHFLHRSSRYKLYHGFAIHSCTAVTISTFSLTPRDSIPWRPTTATRIPSRNGILNTHTQRTNYRSSRGVHVPHPWRGPYRWSTAATTDCTCWKTFSRSSVVIGRQVPPVGDAFV